MNTFLQTGPGSHWKMLIEMLPLLTNLDYAKYYPMMEIKSAELVSEVVSYKLLEKVWGGISARLNVGKHGRQKLLFDYYDYYLANNIKWTHYDSVIFWPQVSLKSIKKNIGLKSRTILEFPMNHPFEWQSIMKSEYKRLRIGSTYNLWPDKWMERMLEEIDLVHSINVLSSFSKKTFVKNGVDPDRITITPLGVDLERFSANVKIPERTFTILFVGRIDCLKGVHNLLKAFKNCGIKDAELILIGDLSEEIKPFLSGDKVKVITPVFGKNLVELYQTAHVLVLPSLQESFGLVILEALSCGTPVIASRNTGGEDIIEEGKDGWLFDPFDVDELTEKLRLVFNSYCDAYREHARMKALKFSKMNYVNNYQKVLYP